jgi:hypothetical protein
MTPHPRVGAAAAIFAFTVSLIATPIVAQQPPVNPEAQVLADFTERVKAYVAMRDKADAGAPKLQETKDAAKIQEAQIALAVRIQQARAGAKQGEIFSPAIEKKLRALLRPEMKGPDGPAAKAAILEEKPVVELKVNAQYPAAEPLATAPPTVLEALPPLPKDQGLEYRFVRKHLILLDTRANLIVDYLYNAIP